MRIFNFCARPLLLVACGLAVTATAGCARFEADYALASRLPVAADEPLAGAWQGVWQSAVTDSQGKVRAILRVETSNRYDLSLELSGFGNIIASWIDDTGLVFESSPDGGFTFHAKIPLSAYNTRGAPIWAEAVEIDGRTDGKVLRFTYRTNDAMRILDRGRVELRRVQS